MEQQEDITQMLLDAGADPNAFDNFHLKPLDLAKNPDDQAIMALLEPLTNSNYECPCRDDGSETGNYESGGKPKLCVW